MKVPVRTTSPVRVGCCLTRSLILVGVSPVERLTATEIGWYHLAHANGQNHLAELADHAPRQHEESLRREPVRPRL